MIDAVTLGGDLTRRVVDHRWLLVGIGGQDPFVEIGPSWLEGWLDLSGDGEIGYFDGVNFHFGRFEITAAGLVVTDIGTTLAFYSGQDPQVLASLRAFAQLTAMSGRTDDGGSRSGELGGLGGTAVGVRVVDSQLELDLPGGTLVFRRAGRIRH